MPWTVLMSGDVDTSSIRSGNRNRTARPCEQNRVRKGRHQQPATSRAQVLTCGAIPGRAGRRIVLHLSKSWGGLTQRIPLPDSILHWQIPTSPKFQPELIT
jgi:hypothetical protein